MNRLIITHYRSRILTALISEDEVLELSVSPERSELGNIYIGKVSRVVKNLNAAFIDYTSGETGYYSLTDGPVAILSSGVIETPSSGDEVIVQVSKEAVKTKDPTLTSDLNLAGRYAVLTPMQKTVGFSSKITDHAWKEEMRPRLEQLLGGESGVIVRTNAYGEDERFLSEVKELLERCRDILSKAKTRPPYSLLYEDEPEYIRSIKNARKDTLAAVITDDEKIYNDITEHVNFESEEDREKLTLYTDRQMPLIKRYSLEAALKQAQQKRVWLRSGGYLIIEQTEAMVVIDVNTGKYSGNTSMDEAVKRINREAAREICHQLRLRNLTGIIMIDFIDMKDEEDRAELMKDLRTLAAQDPVKTTVVDLTQLGLVEMTRKKSRRPLYEQLSNIS